MRATATFNKSQPSFRLNSSVSCALLLILASCGTANDEGYCKKAEPTGYVAGTSDVDGNPWKIVLPEEDLQIKCASGDEGGNVKNDNPATIRATIVDSMGIAKAGLAIRGSIVGETEFMALHKKSYRVTDRCGTAFFYIDWKCPENPGEKREGSLEVYSGALRNSVRISIEHFSSEL